MTLPAATIPFVFDSKIYGSSGYAAVDNVHVDEDGKRKQLPGLVKQMSDRPWPKGKVHLRGRYF